MEKFDSKNLNHRVLTQAELEAIINDWSDDELEIDCITIVPPEEVDENTDEEDFDEEMVCNQDVRINPYF